MSKPNIVLTRIDNRLIHGQVASQWVKEKKAEVLIVANDEAAADKFRQELMNMAAPASVKTVYTSIEDASAALEAAGDKRVLLIVANPMDALRLEKEGIKLGEVNIGNMHMAEGKHQVATTVAVDSTDQAYLKELMAHGCDLFIQRVPGAAVESMEKLWK